MIFFHLFIIIIIIRQCTHVMQADTLALKDEIQLSLRG